jgi:hypothetical protein
MKMGSFGPPRASSATSSSVFTSLTILLAHSLPQVYREINERSSSRSGHKKPYPQDDPSGRNLARRNSPDQLAYKSLASGHPSNDQGTFKPNGLIKKVR